MTRSVGRSWSRVRLRTAVTRSSSLPPLASTRARCQHVAPRSASLESPRLESAAGPRTRASCRGYESTGATHLLCGGEQRFASTLSGHRRQREHLLTCRVLVLLGRESPLEVVVEAGSSRDVDRSGRGRADFRMAVPKRGGPHLAGRGLVSVLHEKGHGAWREGLSNRSRGSRARQRRSRSLRARVSGEEPGSSHSRRARSRRSGSLEGPPAGCAYTSPTSLVPRAEPR